MFDTDGVPPDAEFGVNTDPNEDLESMARMEAGSPAPKTALSCAEGVSTEEDIEDECDMVEAMVSEVDMAREQDDSGLVIEVSTGVSNAVLSGTSLDAVETRLVLKDASTDGDPPREAPMSLEPTFLVD
ncbi:hypothetical protein BG000_003497 [Podila horticola]|nr:hypothetical protein BG000_003497 [Podila horticola]